MSWFSDRFLLGAPPAAPLLEEFGSDDWMGVKFAGARSVTVEVIDLVDVDVEVLVFVSVTFLVLVMTVTTTVDVYLLGSVT